MLRDLVRTVVVDDPALDLVGESTALDDEVIAAARPDVLLSGADALDDAVAEALLRRHCRVRVIGITADGAAATLFEMRPHREPYGELGVGSLRRLLRGSGRER